MICNKCGLNVNQGESFCRNCGNNIDFYNNNQYQPQNNTSQGMYQPQSNTSQGMYQPQSNTSQGMYQSQNNISQGMYQSQYQITNEDNDEMLIDAYIGKNAHKFIPGKFSFCSFFLGIPYYIYRKMWKLLFVQVVITVITSIFLSFLAPIIFFVENIFFAINFNTWYLNHVEKKVTKIKNKNPGASSENLIKICKKKGGTSILLTIIYLVIVIGFFAFLVISSMIATNDMIKRAQKAQATKTLFSLKLRIPENFEKIRYSSFENEYTYLKYGYSDTKNNCEFKGNMVDVDILSKQEYIENQIKSNNAYTTKTINGNVWYYINDKSEDSDIHHYVIEYQYYVYHVEFKILKDNGKCSKGHNELIQALELE